MLKYIPTKARAQAGGFGFQKLQARPKAASIQAQGPAWPGFWPQVGAGTSLANTSRALGMFSFFLYSTNFYSQILDVQEPIIATMTPPSLQIRVGEATLYI